MRGNNVLLEKSFAFAVRAVKLFKYLQEERKEYVLAKQFLRAATSIGANVEESIGGQSDKDFLSKISIAYKEARETMYWLRLLHATDYLTLNEAQSMLTEAEELCKILGKIQITLKNRHATTISHQESSKTPKGNDTQPPIPPTTPSPNS
jgi:four helix bundle protein